MGGKGGPPRKPVFEGEVKPGNATLRVTHKEGGNVCKGSKGGFRGKVVFCTFEWGATHALEPFGRSIKEEKKYERESYHLHTIGGDFERGKNAWRGGGAWELEEQPHNRTGGEKKEELDWAPFVESIR